ncbi:2-amino-4-hydroxy-6-hydroxymethyldihydropteridine diphosphokinase [Dasania sp. GY-MA-18]|uniref:2-amino-4-hydroxy-6-hydroxymethyldihydropteridine diphosphokinase n=1 Tax=Dasania phycosphaerae TaxID=2950436 RepID=A0A9J6RKN0_9GAMM|nr:MULTISPECIES: 2-amino-4-hydroxy-6-hydroxymethyldihydropteridine diphosphokinase [Dasania]MCR8922323.1 2-amino-4-hydroxy-6-hydroxymethyldihydropteridine diphosphokinase [Dasania sp. GY-MA-18]MCZ0864751.1 2-amino-4-hydroxy-6-hydroxymethyldihydropteridine diphosphokinase [Dasania phycosphaerae]MCZ0868479.1 2-amino-4-hydroxy-6-hydroxymethyldihydropteridine diphosphokinase [Dasania phycosphaerae]
MSQVFVSIGSNTDRYRHISASLDALQQCFGELIISPVYESVAVGFEGDNFLNLVVGFETAYSVGELQALLKQIEDDYGRKRGGPKFSSRTLDIDILTVDDLVGEVDGVLLPRPEILDNAFVLLPLFNVAPNAIHPLTQTSYQQLWQDYDQASQQLWSVDFEWNKTKL